jgi:DNA-binding CsgD family transcriptional regulator
MFTPASSVSGLITKSVKVNFLEKTVVKLNWLQTLVENVSYGLGVIDNDLNVLLINQHACNALKIYDEEIKIGQSIFGNRSSPQMGRLINAIRQARDGNRQLVLFRKGIKQLAIAVSPIELTSSRYGVLLTTELVGSCDPVSLMNYGQMLGLTRTEIRVLEKLAQSHNPTAAAQELSIAVPTIRSHIKSILDKTDSSCLRALLVRVSRLPPLSNSVRQGV